MKRKYVWIAVLVAALLFVFVTQFIFTRNAKPYSSDLSQLRAQFNQDKGKVRLVMLQESPPAPQYYMDKIGLGHDLDADKLAVELKTSLESAR